MPPMVMSVPPIESWIGRFLRKRIGRHDRARRLRTAVRAECLEGDRQTGPDLVEAEIDADDAGRSDQHLVDRAADQGSRFRRHAARDIHAVSAGAGVGAAAVGDDGLGDAARTGQVLFRHQHRRCLRAVGREHRHRSSGTIGDQEREVEPLIGFDAGTDTGSAESLWRGHAAGGQFDDVGDRNSHAQWRTAATSAWSRASEVSSGATIATCPQARNLEQWTQSVNTFSCSHRCGTMEKPIEEVPGGVGQRAQPFVAGAPRPEMNLVDDLPAEPLPASAGVHRQRSHFGELAAERCELGAANDFSAADRHDEARRVDRDLVEPPRQQVAFAKIARDQGVQGLGVGRPRRTQGHATVGRHACAPNVASAASSRATASSISASLMTSGGSSRTTVSAVRLTITRCSSPAGTMAAASRVSSRPHISPAPRISLMNAWRPASSRSRVSRCRPTRATCAMSPPSTSSSSTHIAARHASRLPP